MMACILFLYPINSYAASGICRCYWSNKNLAAGYINNISSTLNGYGYSSSVSMIPSKATMKSFIGSSNKVLYVQTHGRSGGGAIECSNDEFLYATELTSGNLFMAYLSACQSAKYSSTYGSFAYKLNLLGIPRVVGFTKDISASTSTNRIHFFNYWYFLYLADGHTLNDAGALAKQKLYAAYGGYFGADSIMIYGTNYYLE